MTIRQVHVVPVRHDGYVRSYTQFERTLPRPLSRHILSPHPHPLALPILSTTQNHCTKKYNANGPCAIQVNTTNSFVINMHCTFNSMTTTPCYHEINKYNNNHVYTQCAYKCVQVHMHESSASSVLLKTRPQSILVVYPTTQ